MTTICKLLVVLLLLLASPSVTGQKSSPVAGDAAELIDLLKKDYSSIDPETRDEEIVRDRAKVIAIFKSYRYQNQTTNIDKNYDKNLQESVGKKKNTSTETELQNPELALKIGAYKNALRKLKDFKLTMGNSANNSTELTSLQIAFDSVEKEYLEASFLANQNELLVLKDVYAQNSYVKFSIDLFITKFEANYKATRDQYAQTNHQTSIQKSLPFLSGNLAFETFIDGLSRFLVKRIKEELTTYVISRIQESLNYPNKESYLNELMVLLPRTTDYIKNFEADEVLNFIDATKQYIEDDLNHLLENAAGLRNTYKFRQLIVNNPDLDFAFEALELVPKLSKIKNPIDYFDLLDNSRNISRWATIEDSRLNIKKEALKFNIANGLRLASMLAHSMTILDNGELKFVSTDFISSYGSEVNFFLLYIGFLHQQNLKYYNIKFAKADANRETFGFESVMRDLQPETVRNTSVFVSQLQNELGKIAEHAEKIQNMATAIKNEKTSEKGLQMETVNGFVEEIINISEQITRSADALRLGVKSVSAPTAELSFKIADKARPYFLTARASNEIVLDLHNKKYSSAIIKALEVPTLYMRNEIDLGEIEKLEDRIRNSDNLLEFKNILTQTQLPQNENELDIIQNSIVLLDIATKKRKVGLDQTITALKGKLEMINRSITELEKAIAQASTDDEKKLIIEKKDTAEKVKEGIDNQIKSISSSNRNIITLQGHLKQLKGFVSSNDKDGYAIEFNNLKSWFTKEGQWAAANLDNLDIEGLLKNPIQEYLKKQGLKGDELDDSIGNYFSTLLGKMVGEGVLKPNELDKVDGVQAARNSLNSAIQAYLPELTKTDADLKAQSLLKIIYFVNDIALSETADDVEKAIDAFALPSGSFSLKGKNKHYVSINSFPGLLVGLERSGGKDLAFAPGFTAPIGIYSNFFKACKGQVGVFVPILDIAAPVRFRLDDDKDTSVLPEFNFQNILSPGLYLTYSSQKSPLTLNVGLQFGPELELIEEAEDGSSEATTTILKDSFRIGVGLTIDIPLLTLYNRPN